MFPDGVRKPGRMARPAAADDAATAATATATAKEMRSDDFMLTCVAMTGPILRPASNIPVTTG